MGPLSSTTQFDNFFILFRPAEFWCLWVAPPHTPWVKSVGKVSWLDRLALVGLRSGNGGMEPGWNPVRTRSGARLEPGQEPGWDPVRSPVGTRSGTRLNPVEVLLKMHSPKLNFP